MHVQFRVLASAALLFSGALVAQGAAPPATNYAIFARNGIQLQSYSAVQGNMYSSSSIALDFGYGIQVSNFQGNAQTQRNFTLGDLSSFKGNVNANRSLTLQGGQIFGNGVYGTTVSLGNGNPPITGTLTHQANSVASIPLMSQSVFTPGDSDVLTGDNLALSPGSYYDVTETGLYKTVSLSSGNYYLNSLTLQGSSTLSLNISNGQPINVFVKGDISLDSGLSINVNGIPYTSPSSGIDNTLARLVTFETDQSFYNPAGFLSYFFGTIFAPNGDIQMQFDHMEGALLAGGTINGKVYLDYQPSAALQGIPDLNRDGHVNAADILAMEQALADLHAYQTAKNLSDAQLLTIADLNGDGIITNADLQALVKYLKNGGGSVDSVPEPASIILLALGMIPARVALRRRRVSCPVA